MTRVAIFNDSRTVRAHLRVILESSGFDVVLEAEDGRLAGQRVVESRAELVLMDVLMPHIDGYAATRDVIKTHPVPIVIVTGALNPKDSAVIFSALAAGALYVTRPPQNPVQAAGFVQLLRAVAGARPHTSDVPTPTAAATVVVDRARPLAISVIAFAASAGGPQALTEVLAGLPPDVLPPILVVQHLSAQFEESFAAWLASTTKHKVMVARQGAVAHRGHVYLAGHGTHLLWKNRRLHLSGEPSVNHFRPSATVLLRSLVSEGDKAMAVVLSGMGTDGAQGAQEMHKAGGHVVVQSRDSASVWGMPGEVVKRQAANIQLPVAEIARHILRVTGLE